MRAVIMLLVFLSIAFAVGADAKVQPISAAVAQQKAEIISAEKTKKEKIDRARSTIAKVKDADVRKALEELAEAVVVEVEK